MSNITDKVERIIKEDIDSLKLELEYIEFVKEGTDRVLRIVIDSPGKNISIDDCESLSRIIDEKIEKEIKADTGYILEVSSAGLERQLKNIKLFEKYKGYNIKIKLYKKINDKKELEGILLDVKDDKIIIKVDSEELEIEMKSIAHANTIYDFKF